MQQEQTTVRNWWKARLHQASAKNLRFISLMVQMLASYSATTARIRGLHDNWFEINIINSYQDETMKKARQWSRGNTHCIIVLPLQRELGRALHNLHQFSQSGPVHKNYDFPDQCHTSSFTTFFSHKDIQSGSQKLTFFPYIANID